MVHGDGEFEPLNNIMYSLPGAPLVNLSSANEHVPDIKLQIRVVKEQCRATQHSLSLQWMSNLLTTHIVLNSVKMINFFPTKGGISDNLSPKTIMSGKTLDYKNCLRLHLEQY